MGKLKYFWDAIKLLLAYFIGTILKISKNNRDIWLIGERKSEAKDNGYHLFKYIRQNHTKDKVYYVIDKNSNDLDKIVGFGNVIYADTFKHYLYYAMSIKLVIAHLGSCVPETPICWKLEGKNLIRKKRAFIQHGITKELIPSLMYENTRADLFICGAKPEYDFVKSEFGYPEECVKYTGFSRFDNLHEIKEKQQILLMPTWRQWIPSMTWSLNNNSECRKIFLQSEYYIRFNEFINNEKLIELLEKNDTELIFYPHYEMQGYLDLFKSKSNKINIANKDKYDVQTLLKESKVLITDYSSVAFDFGYMRKPVIYYQFDEDKYYKNHYHRGYFMYDKHGFGPVVKKEIELIDYIEGYMNNSTLYKNYARRADEMFTLNDENNSSRQYHLIRTEL